MQTDIHRVLDEVWRNESARVIGALMRMLRDLSLAEEFAQDALVAALERWPRTGVPDNPGAWLMATARHRAIDRLRRQQLIRRKHEGLRHDLDDAWQGLAGPDDADVLDDAIGDDVLRLMFVACHPVLAPAARVALTLRLLGGLTTGEIARAFLQPEPTVAQRIVRAKKTLARARIAFEVPTGAELEPRLESVLEVIYLVFNEGYAATAGDDWMRPALCGDALRLAGVLAGVAPGQPEVHGLLALMELQASRLGTRTSADGEPVLLSKQDRSRWDHGQIARGLAALQRTTLLGGGSGRYALQAAIAACHARAATPADTDWTGIAALYDRLAMLSPSPVVELNRAVAWSMAHGPAAGLALADALRDEPALLDYHLLPAVRGDLLERLGRHAEARMEFERAATLAGNLREQALLRRRAAECRQATPAIH